MAPPLPVWLATDTLALEPSATSRPARMSTLPPLALRRPFTRASLAATIWIAPLRTTILPPLCRPLLLTVEAKRAACSRLAASRGPTETFWPVNLTESTALMRPRMRILPSGDSGTVPASRLSTAPWLIWPERLTTPSTNSRVGVETLSEPTLTTPDRPTTKPPGAAK